jgi:cell division transport system ATP-binding protein
VLLEDARGGGRLRGERRLDVALPLRVRGGGGAALTSDVKAVLERVRLTDKESRFPRELSGGEQRKVAIARAVVANPEILLCDEPTESLSAERATEIVDLLLDINADGVTTVVATHDTGTVNRLRRRVIHMDNGCVQSDTLVGSAAPPSDTNGSS